MKLKDGFILQDVGGEHMAVASGSAGKVFNGLVRNNGTADFIFRALMKETSEEAVVETMAERYDASRDRIAEDVARLIAQFRKAELLDE